MYCIVYVTMCYSCIDKIATFPSSNFIKLKCCDVCNSVMHNVSRYIFCKHGLYIYFIFLKFLGDTHVLFGGHACPFWGPLVPLFWISGDVSSGYQSQSGFCLIRIAEVNVMYIPRDPPLVLHMPTSWQLACCQSSSHILLQR